MFRSQDFLVERLVYVDIYMADVIKEPAMPEARMLEYLGRLHSFPVCLNIAEMTNHCL